jgi:hypothetical protein
VKDANIVPIMTLYCLSAISTVTLAQPGVDNNRVAILGYVAHGVNVFNGQFLTDYSEASPQVPWLMPEVPIYEIGAFIKGTSDVDVITESTDPAWPVAIIRPFADFFNPEGDFDPDLLNQLPDEIDSNTFGYPHLDERFQPVSFNEAVAGDVYQGANTNSQPTVGEWNAASGLMRFQCHADGGATAEIAVRNAFPNGVYTLWDIGALHPLTEQEEGYGVPFGGLPNIMLTDSNGCGYKQVEVPFCPNRPCEAGADSCTSYISASYHWDHQAYSAAPTDHLVWPMSGTPLQEEAQNPFPLGNKLTCRTEEIEIMFRMTLEGDVGNDGSIALPLLDIASDGEPFWELLRSLR